MPVAHRLPARFTLAHGLMIVAGLLTFVLVTMALRDRAATIEVAFATEASAAGSITPQLTAIPASTPGIDHFARPADLAGKVLARSVPEGQPIMKSDLIDDGRLEFRILALPIDRYQLEGLQLRRLDRVDVVGFDADRRPVYLGTDLVVAAPPGIGGEGFGGLSEGFVTLQVDEVDALRLSVGLQHGPLHLVRSTGAVPVTRLATLGVPAGAEQAEGGQP